MSSNASELYEIDQDASIDTWWRCAHLDFAIVTRNGELLAKATWAPFAHCENGCAQAIVDPADIVIVSQGIVHGNHGIAYDLDMSFFINDASLQFTRTVSLAECDGEADVQWQVLLSATTLSI